MYTFSVRRDILRTKFLKEFLDEKLRSFSEKKKNHNSKCIGGETKQNFQSS